MVRCETNIKPIKIYASHKSRGGEKIFWRYWGRFRHPDDHVTDQSGLKKSDHRIIRGLTGLIIIPAGIK